MAEGSTARLGANRLAQRGFGSAAVGLAAASRLGFERDAARAPEVAASVLGSILSLNRDSEYGRRHGFASIGDPEAYRRRVPVITYDDIADDIDRMAHQGRTNVLTSDHVDAFMLTSGTSGKPKLIPTTEHERRRRIPALVFVPQGTLLRHVGPGALLGKGMNGMSIAATDKATDAGIPISSSLRIGLGERTRLLKLLFSSPICAYAVRDVATAYYLHWLFALVDRDLRYVADEFASKMAFALSVLCDGHESLADCLERGTLDPDLAVADEVRAEVDALLARDPRRAAEVRAAFAAGPAGVLRRLWPNMHYLACITTGTFSVYEPALRDIAGALPIFNTTYGLSECAVAVSMAPDDPRYLLYPRGAYLEYVPEDDIGEERPAAKLLGELEVGGRYEIVTTNHAGLYRYRTSDVIHVVGMHRRTPIIEFSHRANVLMNFNAEMMTEATALSALRAAAAERGTRLVDYSVRPGAETFPPHYCFYVELSDLPDAEGHAAFTAAVERHLGVENPRYEDRVTMGRLLPCRVRVVEAGGFRSFEMELGAAAQENGISVVQTKVPRLLRHEDHLAMLDRRVVQWEPEHVEEVNR